MAPRINMVDRQVGIGAQQTAARIDPGVFATSGMQVAGAADAVVQFIAARDKARNEADLLRAKAAASRQMTNLQLEMEQDTDWRTMDQRFADKARTIHDSLADGISDPGTKATFSMAFDEAAQSKMVSVRRRSWDLESNQSRADLDQVLADNARNAAANPLEAPRYLKDGLKDIASMQAAGYITAEDAGKRSRKFLADHDEAKARTMISADPEKAALAVMDGREFGNLDELARSRLADMAQRRADAVRSERVRQQEKAERDADKALKRRQEDNAYSAMLSAEQGNLSIDRLHEMARTRSIDVQHYAAVRSALEKGGVDDPRTFVSIQDRIARGEDARSDILREASEGRLTAASAAGFLEKSSSITRGEGIYSTHDYREVTDALRKIIVTTGPGAQFVRGDEQDKLRRATQELDGEIRRQGINPSNSHDVWRIFDDMSSRYQSSPPSIYGLPRPRFGEIKTVGDIDKVASATLDAMQRGDISESQMQAEDALLRQYTTILQRQQELDQVRQSARDKSGGASRADKILKNSTRKSE